MADTPLHYMTITEVAALIKAREISPVEVTEAMLRRIEAIDGTYRSYATVMADQAQAAAKAAEAEIAAGQYREAPCTAFPSPSKTCASPRACARWAAARCTWIMCRASTRPWS